MDGLKVPLTHEHSVAPSTGATDRAGQAEHALLFALALKVFAGHATFILCALCCEGAYSNWNVQTGIKHNFNGIFKPINFHVILIIF